MVRAVGGSGRHAHWYLSIADGGYAHASAATALATHAQENWVYFPLFPFSARTLAHLLDAPVLWTGVVLANVCFLAFLYVLFRWVRREWGSRAARYAVALAGFMPLAAYTVEFRETSMLLLLSTVCLERLSRRHMVQAAVAGGLASLTQPDALLLAVPFVIVCWTLLRRPERRTAGLAGLALVPAFAVGAATMAWVSAADTGTALAFVREQAAWGRSFRLPFDAFVPFLQHPSWVSTYGWASEPIAIAATVAGLAAAAYLWRRRAAPELAIYLLVVVVAATASTVVLGLPRFVVGAPPLYVAGGLAPRRAAIPVLVLSAAAMVLYTIYWLLGAHWAMS